MKVSRRETIDRYYLAKWRGWGVFVHRIHHSDPRGVMHTHPWSWLSIILGAYVEERVGRAPRKRRLLNWMRAGIPHRVTVSRTTWTLLVHGPRRCAWAVTDDTGKVIEFEPWSGTERSYRTSYRRTA